jgi:integrase/recombinase XerD
MEPSCDQFIRYLATERGLSAAYQLSVRQTLDALAGWMKSRSTSLPDLGTDELAAFLSQRKSDGLNAASLRITTVHLKIFFRWLVMKCKLEMDPAEPLLAPRPDQTLPETLHASELVKLLESIDPSSPLGRRDLAILELFYSSGLRLSELCKARLEMMDSEEGFLRVTGKGGKTRIVRVGNKAREATNLQMAGIVAEVRGLSESVGSLSAFIRGDLRKAIIGGVGAIAVLAALLAIALTVGPAGVTVVVTRWLNVAAP